MKQNKKEIMKKIVEKVNAKQEEIIKIHIQCVYIVILQLFVIMSILYEEPSDQKPRNQKSSPPPVPQG